MRSFLVVASFVVLACGDPAAPPSAEHLGGGPAPAEARRAPSFTYQRGVLIAHWIGGVAPIYEGQSKILHTYAAPWFDEEDLGWIADHGFDHVQIPVDAGEWRPETGRLPDAKLAPFEQVVRQANDAGLGVVLVFDAEPGDTVERVTEAWSLIAERFASVGEGLRFQAGNDDSVNPTPWFRAYVTAIRRVSPTRFFYLTTQLGEPLEGEIGLAGTEERNRAQLRNLELATFDEHVGIAFQYWEPQVFTCQHPTQKVKVPFPGVVPDFRTGAVEGTDGGAVSYNAIAAAASNKELHAAGVSEDLASIARVAAAEAPGRELYMGRFGLVQGIEADSARRYLETLLTAARRHRIGWTIYDYESGRAIRDADGNPTPIYDGLGLSRRHP